MEILVADDDVYNRQLITLILEEAGHRCVHAEDGRQAIELWRDLSPDIVLMDMVMPVMDGIESARQIKEEAGQNHVPILFLTALNKEETLARCLEIGDDFLGKPVNFDVLKAKISAHERILRLNRKVTAQNRELEYHHIRTRNEHEMTRHLMEAAQNVSAKDVPGITVHCTAASFFNGDLVLVQEKRDGGAYILVGDFTGHGLAASVGSIPVSQAFRTMCSRNLAVSDIARELNVILERFLPDSMFFAATLGEISPSRNRMELWCGGLPDAYVVAGDRSLRRKIQSNHMPLGILPEQEFESVTEIVSLTPEDSLVFYTDGVIECTNRNGEMFGEEGLEQVLRSAQGKITDAVVSAVHGFNDDPELQDDLSLVEISCAFVGSEKLEPDYPEELPDTSIATRLPAMNLGFVWRPEQLREPDPLTLVRQWLGSHAAVRPQREIVFMVIAELFSNALEHGVLGLSSAIKQEEEGFDRYYQLRQQALAQLQDGWVSLNFEVNNIAPLQVTIQVSDSGSGFTPSLISLEDNDDEFGRGLPLLAAMCEKLEFAEDGSHIRATMNL